MAPLALLLLLLAGTASLPRPAAACTSYIVGRAASGDGSVIIARNDDGEGAVDPSNLVYHPARDAPAVWRSNINALQVTLPAPGLAYFGVPNGPLADAAAGRNTSGEAAGINSAGVAISATESIYNSAAALAAGACAAGQDEWGRAQRTTSRRARARCRRPSLLLPPARAPLQTR